MLRRGLRRGGPAAEEGARVVLHLAPASHIAPTPIAAAISGAKVATTPSKSARSRRSRQSRVRVRGASASAGAGDAAGPGGATAAADRRRGRPARAAHAQREAYDQRVPSLRRADPRGQRAAARVRRTTRGLPRRRRARRVHRGYHGPLRHAARAPRILHRQCAALEAPEGRISGGQQLERWGAGRGQDGSMDPTARSLK